IRRVLRRTKLRWHIIRNRHELIILPQHVDKSTGGAAALEQLKGASRDAVAIGDAENDRPMLKLCGLGVAVKNAVPKLKRNADLVTRGQYGKGVAELIDQILANGSTRKRRQRKASE